MTGSGTIAGGDATRFDFNALEQLERNDENRLDLVQTRSDRLPLRPVLVLVIQDHPHRALTDLVGVLALAWHDSILLKDRSGVPRVWWSRLAGL